MAETNFLPHHLFLFIFSISLFSCCTAIDFISQNQTLRDRETIVSQGQIFELGFFSPKNSKYRYVGIWYKKVSVQTVVWVANREKPLTDSFGILSIDGNGNLVVLDGSGNIVWSSNTSVIFKNSTATLLDSGNLVLQEEESSEGQTLLLWQSFDHPSDTYLPTMRIGTNLKTGEKQSLTASKSESDLSPGSFSIGLEPQVVPQVFLYNGSDRIWRSGQWNGQIFIGLPHMYSAIVDGFKVIRDDEEGKIYVTFSLSNTSITIRFIVDWMGTLKQPIWEEDKKEWLVRWSEPYDECDVYGMCGPFGRCKLSKLMICSCLIGFVRKWIDEWQKGNWTGGCVRRTPLQCEGTENSTVGDVKRDGFLKIGGVKLPDLSDWLSVGYATACKDACFRNCSCVAFAYVSGIGCMVWVGDLMDIRDFSSGGEDLFIRLADSELVEERPRGLPLAIVAVVSAAFLGGAGCIVWMWIRKRRGNENFSHGLPHLGKTKVQNKSLNAEVIGDGVEHVKGFELPVFDLGAIANATDSFCDANKLGEGGFGPVYKGTLQGGQEIAVKRLSKNSGQGLEEFKNEVILISKLQHRNLVRLLGCCIEGDEKMLIYEYMSNKSLDGFLFDPSKQARLDWVKRYNIVQGIARGLLYLHRDSRLRIIHRDLKASNILLDGEMNPKISDFGIARIFGGNQTPANTNRVVGTYGYMAPEYAMAGRFSEKSDVFSFGVMLLEIVTGRRNTDFYHLEQIVSLIGYAWKLWNEDKVLQLIDPSLGHSCSTVEVLRCIHVGLLCVQECETDRPTMSSVVLMLSEAASRPMPKQPAFSFARRQTMSHSSLHSNEIYSVNGVTVTLPEGR